MDIISIVIGLVVGAVVAYIVLNVIGGKRVKGRIEEMNAEADRIIKNARSSAERITKDANEEAKRVSDAAEKKNEDIKQQKIRDARRKYQELKESYQTYKSEQKLELKEREIEVKTQEKEFTQKVKDLEARNRKVDAYKQEVEQKEEDIKAIKESLEKQLKVIAKKKEQLDAANDKHIQALEAVARLSEQEAKEQLLEAVQAKAETEALAVKKRTLQSAKLSANKEAKKIVIQTIQRMCAEYTIENTVSVFNLNSDDLKGQIIGREGRNIRALEAATGAEIVVDDTPEAIVISSFDPVRREVCRQSLKRLVADGRIHPARIEEVVAKTRKEIDEQIVEIGERTVIELDIHGLDDYLIKMVGRMRFRSSYGQNLLKHSIETAKLCAVMASELGLSKKQIKLAKRAGLLHDIGKVTEEETELSHALLGMKLCEKHGEHPVVCNAVGAHHDEIEMNNILSPVIQACDAISGARPGARREILESYLKRISELEELALEHEGVQKAYALQAGRELRVIVESEKVSDQSAEDLSFMISQKIQDEMQYPGQIRVTVIREKRAVSIAR